MTWRRIDLHLHTPASLDYQQPNVSPLDILRRAEERGLDVVAFTDHNSVRGYADMWREIEDLELLEYLQRLEPAEAERLQEYRRLLSKILVLPGFEFTATFGFHILAIFPEQSSVRLMEHLLLLLGVPEERFGSGEVGATTDVLRAYEILADHGALVIGAHVNSTHGIAMQGLRFGGQTKIAYTQDPHLHALEVTDLALGPHRRSTARFFNGTKPEYPRRMHCIQGSDAHRLDRDPERETNLGVGDRATEALLPEISFAALKDLFQGTNFDHVRPYAPAPDDPVKAARASGNTATQAFHENLTTKRTGLGHILRDLVGLANADGGTVYVGLSASEKRPIVGVDDPTAAASELTAAVSQQVTPTLAVAIDAHESDGKTVLVVTVPRGTEKPYALAPGAIYVRRDGESQIAGRDEIVAMVREAAPVPALAKPAAGPPPATPGRGQGVNGGSARTGRQAPAIAATAVLAEPPARQSRRRGDAAKRETGGERAPAAARAGKAPAMIETVIPPLEPDEEDAPVDPIAPTTGIEIKESYEQDGVTYYTLHDLRNHKLIFNVTRNVDRRLWRSAISQREEQEVDESQVRWHGDYGLWRSYRPRGGERRYNVVYRGDGDLRVFYGVSEAGMDERWRAVLPSGAATG